MDSMGLTGINIVAVPITFQVIEAIVGFKGLSIDIQFGAVIKVYH